jgi:LPXTG-motif cell wall-anchored protein
MTNIKAFIIGALSGVLGATILGATIHFLLIGLAVVGAGAVALRRRRRLLSRRHRHKAVDERGQVA